ncbi:hypothetical protein GQ42DRAFT_154706 [Ramicandelaber brevisporus]|nr:hypothetical protein GQ42DRAFT_154706 [Ramicandelaber brevisporus]
MSSLSLATEQTAVAEPQSPSTSSLAVPTTPTASSSSTAVASALPRKLFRLGWKQSSSSTTLTAAAAASSSPVAGAGAVTAGSPTSDSNSAPQPPLRPTVGLHDTLFINQHWSLLTSLKYGLESPRPIANGSVAAPVPSADLSIASASDQRATCYLRRLSMISVPGLERTLIREVFNMSPFLREFKCDMINKHRQQMALKRKAATNAINTPMS